MQTVSEMRVSRSGIYMEKALYDIAQKEADENDQTFSTWGRRILFEHLLSKGKIPQELLQKLAAR